MAIDLDRPASRVLDTDQGFARTWRAADEHPRTFVSESGYAATVFVGEDNTAGTTFTITDAATGPDLLKALNLDIAVTQSISNQMAVCSCPTSPTTFKTSSAAPLDGDC